MIGRALILGTAALLSGCATTAPEPTTDPAIARELAAMEESDEKTAQAKILQILNEHAPLYYAEKAL